MACSSGFQKVSEATRKAREMRKTMPELLITRVQDAKMLETTVKELNDECERAQKPRFQETDVIAKASKNVINNMDTSFATKKAATNRSSSTRSKRDGKREGCLRQGHEDEQRKSLPAKLVLRSSLKSRRSQQGSLESMVRKESPERAQRATTLDKVTCCTKLREGLGPTAREVTRSTKPLTTIKSIEMKPMNLQEEMKKLEEQESAVNVACPVEDEASWVITCKGDHEEEILQFDGETVKKMMINEISTFLSNVDQKNLVRR